MQDMLERLWYYIDLRDEQSTDYVRKTAKFRSNSTQSGLTKDGLANQYRRCASPASRWCSTAEMVRCGPVGGDGTPGQAWMEAS